MDYKKAGVDIEAGYKSVELMKKHVKETMRPEVLGGLGGFAGAFDLSAIKNMEEPVLLSGTDGCGTKVKLAFVMDKHDTIGIDAVAMCVNDIACSGGEPLFFLDYIACGKNYPEKIATIVSGVAEGCKQSECALVGGETAEHPGLMPENDYDLAGFAVGVVDKKDIIIDCLTLTASAQQKEVQETLKALTLVKQELGVHTVLGVSNVSFGLPNRPLLNRTFLTLAMQAGLDLPIINPLDEQLMSTIDAYNVLYNFDQESIHYISKQSQIQTIKPQTSPSFSLEDIIIHGLKEEVKAKTKEVLQTSNAMDIINHMIVPALNKVGKDYENNKIFLPQLIQSAETTKLAFEVVKTTLNIDSQTKGPILMCTVEGDIHDIGKNIVKVILESYGYYVIDLGKDIKVEKVVEAYHQYQPLMIGLSALMTTTVVNMKRTIEALHEKGCQCPIWVGGAVLTQDIADEIGADYYCEDAMASVMLLNKVLK